MTYYPLPDIPIDAPPAVRRFCEQVRTALSRIDNYGQPLEVHHLFYAEPTGADDSGVWLSEFPVYRADVAVELLYATWTTTISGGADFDIKLYWRPGDTAADPVLLQEIDAGASSTTPFLAFVPKRFTAVTRSRRILANHILTIDITATVENADIHDGLLSMYFRRAEVN